MTAQAKLAIYAAKHTHIWGPDAARRYCFNHGVHLGLYRVARQCELLKSLLIIP